MRTIVKSPILTIKQIRDCQQQFFFLPKRDAALFEIALNTGLRIETILTMRYSNFLDQNLNSVRVLSAGATSHQYTPIIIHGNLHNLILSCYKTEPIHQPLDTFIFRSKARNACVLNECHLTRTSAWKIIKKIFEKAEIPIEYPPESLRASYFYYYWGIRLYSEDEIISKYKNVYL